MAYISLLNQRYALKNFKPGKIRLFSYLHTIQDLPLMLNRI